jgi:hypothetical protein
MLVEQTDQHIRILFSGLPAADCVALEYVVVDLDRDRDLAMGVEVVCLLRSLKARGTEATMPQNLSPEARYDAISDGLYVELNRDKGPRFPLRQLHQPHIRAHVLLSRSAEVVGVEVDLPADKPWPGCSRRGGSAPDLRVS